MLRGRWISALRNCSGSRQPSCSSVPVASSQREVCFSSGFHLPTTPSGVRVVSSKAAVVSFSGISWQRTPASESGHCIQRCTSRVESMRSGV